MGNLVLTPLHLTKQEKKIMVPCCPKCNGQRGAFDHKKVWRVCLVCKGHGKKKQL